MVQAFSCVQLLRQRHAHAAFAIGLGFAEYMLGTSFPIARFFVMLQSKR